MSMIRFLLLFCLGWYYEDGWYSSINSWLTGCWAHHPMDVIRHIYFYSGIMSGNQNGYLIACRTRLAGEWWWSWIWDWIWNSSAWPSSVGFIWLCPRRRRPSKGQISNGCARDQLIIIISTSLPASHEMICLHLDGSECVVGREKEGESNRSRILGRECDPHQRGN